jgi:hypothetical protein
MNYQRDFLVTFYTYLETNLHTAGVNVALGAGKVKVHHFKKIPIAFKRYLSMI